MNENELKKLLANPFYTLRQVHPDFTLDHEVMVSEEEWIKSGVNLIKEIGAEEYLKLLLENLKGNFVRGEADEAIGYKS